MSKSVLKPLKKRMKKRRVFTERTSLFSIRQYITIPVIFKCAIAFLLSGTKLIGGAPPMGLAFSAALFTSSGAYAAAIFSILGLIARGAGLYTVVKYLFATILISLVYEKIISPRHGKSPVIAVSASLSLFVSGLSLLFLTSTVGGFPLLYDLVVLIVECASLWICIHAFSIAIPVVFSLNLRRTLSPEETVSLTLLAGGTICGLGNLGFPGVFTLTGTLCVLFVLAFATAFGSLHGCCAGIIMGVICCLSRGRIDACAASFALSGLCAGYFSRYGKWSGCISFIMANSVITILSNGSTEVLINIFDTLIAAVILYCMPKKVVETIKNIGSTTQKKAALASQKLEFAARTLEKCETSFRSVAKLRSESDMNRMLLYRRILRKSCAGCGLRKYCWGRDCASTKASVDLLLQSLENAESITADNAPVHCLRRDQFINDFIGVHDLYKNDCVWVSRMQELQASVYESFKSVSALLDSYASKLSAMPECDEIASEDVRMRLRKDGINAKTVFVSGSGDDMQVHITFEKCGGFGRCENAVYKVLEDSIGKQFIRTGLRSCGECSHLYVVRPSFSITTAITSAVKANRRYSGDYAVYSLLDRQTYAIILCDGMGSGETAREESRTCASLLMRLLECGLDGKSAINIINSMFLQSTSGTLAAIDLCLISLEDGTSRIYKCGGAGSFARTQNGVTQIEAPSLPLGTNAHEASEFFSIDSGKGSMIVLVSDGIGDTSGDVAPWIKKLMEEYDGTEPQALAQLILDRAKSTSTQLQDDITVVAAYIG